LRFAIDHPTEVITPKGLAKEGEQFVHPTLAPKPVRAPRLVKSR